MTAELRAQALVLRWAALQLEQRITTSHRRKLRHDSGEAYDQGLEFAAEQLRQWARTIHRRPAPREEVVERPRASLSGRVPL